MMGVNGMHLNVEGHLWAKADSVLDFVLISAGRT